MLVSLVESIDVMLRAERGVQQVIDSVRSQPAWRRWLGGSARTIAALSATLEGLKLGIQRMDRSLATHGLESVSAVGRSFDPESMEAIEAVPGTGQPAGTVIEEIRRGYQRGNEVFRYAQVKVAK